jgi:26S proteasome regulatory subunit N2
MILIQPIAKCIDTFISLSASRRPAVGETPLSLNTAFPSSNDATNTSASLASPITPFSQSALPSKSLLSREEESSSDATYAGGEESAAKYEETSLVVRRGVQKQLQGVIERLFEQCFRQHRYRQVVGIAIEAKNLDVLRTAILRCSEAEKQQGETSRHGEELIEYVLDICMGVIQERSFRNEVCGYYLLSSLGVP